MGGEHLLRFRVFRDHVFDEILTFDHGILPRNSSSALRLINTAATESPKEIVLGGFVALKHKDNMNPSSLTESELSKLEHEHNVLFERFHS